VQGSSVTDPSLLERRLKLLDELAELARKADQARVRNTSDKVHKVTNIASSLYANMHMYLSDNQVMPVKSSRTTYYAWLGITSLWYLGRRGFKDVLDYLPKADHYGVVHNLKGLTVNEDVCLTEFFGEAVAGADVDGYPYLFGLDLTPIPHECGKLNHISLLLMFLGAIVHEMVLNLKVPRTIEYPITPLATEIVDNIISWGSGASSLGYYTVEANIGMGKTTYVYKSILGAIRLLTGQPPEAYRLRAWDLFIGEADELNELLKQYKGMPVDYFIPLIVIEDATHVFPKYWTWMGKEFVMLMNSVHEGLIPLRGRMANLIMNANSASNLASFARDLAHKRLVGVDANIGSVKHTLFYSPVRRYVNPYKMTSNARFIGATAYPLTKLPDEIYRLDLEHKNKILDKTFSRTQQSQ